MRTPALALAFALLALPAAAQEQGTKFISRLTVGFDGRVADVDGYPTPVWLTLQNTRDRQVELRLVARSRTSRVEERIVLPAGGRRRVCLALEIKRRRVLVRLFEGAVLLEETLVEELKTITSPRQLLCLDARPGRGGRSSRPEDTVLAYLTIDPRLSPTEPSCFRIFGAVLLREADPDLWSLEQRAALLEHVANGGTLIVTGVTQQRPKAVAFVESLPAALPESRKLLGRPVEVRTIGLGRVLSFPDDLLGAAYGTTPKAAQLKQSLSDMVKFARGGNGFARLFQGDVGVTFAERPGFVTKCLVGIFALAYLLAAGPILGVVLRKANRGRLAVVTALLIAGFSLFAFLVAGIVRVGQGTAYVREVLYVPAEGPGLWLGDVTVLSGGAITYDLRLTGADMAATSIPSGTERERSWQSGGWEYRAPQVPRVQTQRGQQIDLKLEMAPWDRQSVSTIALSPGTRSLHAVMRRGKLGYEVEVKNTTPHLLRNAVVMEEGVSPGVATPFLDLGDLEPGATVRGLVRRGASARLRFVKEEETWSKALDVPSDWSTWAQVVPHPPRSLALRYNVISRVEPSLKVSGPNLDSVSYALRIDPVDVEGLVERGWLGVSVEAGSRFSTGDGVREEVQVARVSSKGPARKAGIKPGLVINTVNGQQITSVRQFQALLSRSLPGEQVRLGCWDPQAGRQRMFTVKLATRVEIEER